MADVRSLLRNELASRKGSSPNTAGNRVSKKRKVDNGDGVMRKKLRATDLETVEAAANAQNAEIAATNARDHRDDLLYNGTDGILTRVKLIKKYIGSITDTDSPQYKQIQALQFKKA